MERLESVKTVLYELYCKPFGTIRIQPPKGWDNDSRSYDRDKDSKGITSKTEVSLEFYGDAADYLKTIFTGFGVQERVLLTKRAKNLYSLSEEWILRYVQELDMTTYKYDYKTGRVRVKATEGGLYDDIKNRESDDYNLINNESADGEYIGEIKTHKFQAYPRGIFLESYLREQDRSNYTVNTTVSENTGTDRYNIRTIPMKLIYSSDIDGDIVSANGSVDSYDTIEHELTSEAAGDRDPTTNHFLEQAERTKTFKVKMRLKFKISDFYERNTYQEEFKVAFRIGERSGDQTILKSHETLTSNEGVSVINPVSDRSTYTYDFEREVTVEQGESLSFVFASSYVTENLGIGQSAKTTTYLSVEDSWIKVVDQTKYEPTVSRVIKPLDLFDRLVAKITGKTGLVRSTVFGKGGEYESMVVDNGFWARGFPDTIINEQEEEEQIQFKTSFKDAFESFCYLEPLCWFVDIEGDKQVLRIEKATYTMQNFIGVKLGAVDEIESESSKNDWFSSIELGCGANLEYEEINGLDEPNGKSEFTTHITRAKNKYSVLTKYRFDSVGYELIRRKPYDEFPKEDTPRDESIWVHDAKWTGSFYTHNLYSDVGMSLPKGIFAPETAWNLRLSPMNRLFYGHGYSVKRGLYHYPNKHIRFRASNANQNMITSIGGFELSEGVGSAKIRIGDIEKPRIEAVKTSFTFKMTQEIENQFAGFTQINGRNVPNYFGLIEYLENGQTKYGRLVKLEADEQSKITLMNAKL